MREKFFETGHYRLRLDDIRAKETKPINRIHLNCSMSMTETDLYNAPTKLRRVWEIVANPQLDTVKVALTSKLKGIDIEVYPTPPTSKKVPLLVCLSNCILRDIEVHRRLKGEIRLYFSVGIAFDSAVWKWGGKQVFMDCFAKFSHSQTELFDDHPADQAIEKPQGAPHGDVEALARELGTAPPEPAGAPANDPLGAKPAKMRRMRKLKDLAPEFGKKRNPKPGNVTPVTTAGPVVVPGGNSDVPI